MNSDCFIQNLVYQEERDSYIKKEKREILDMTVEKQILSMKELGLEVYRRRIGR